MNVQYALGLTTDYENFECFHIQTLQIFLPNTKFTFTNVGPTIVTEYARQLQNDYLKASKLFANITAFVKIY